MSLRTRTDALRDSDTPLRYPSCSRSNVCSILDARAGGDASVGTNKRYADYYDRKMNERIEQSANPAVIVALTEEQLDKRNATLRRSEPPIPVRVWLQFSDQTAVEVNNALAVAYTSKCVFVEGEHNKEKFGCWVWANAVTRITPRELY